MANIFSWMSSSRRKQKVQAFMAKIMNSVHLSEVSERQREEKRCNVALGIRVIPCKPNSIDPDRGAAFNAVLRDVSCDGLSYTHRRQSDQGERVIATIDYDGARMHVLCEVRHCSSIDRGFFQTGCLILDQIENGPELED